MLHNLVVKDGMEFLKFAQGDRVGYLASHVQDFSKILIMVPMKEMYANKLIFLHGLKPWVWNFFYQKMDILDTYQGLMKMVECMENKGLLHPRVKLEVRSPRSIMPCKVVEAKAKSNASGAKVKLGSHDNKKNV
jgi:hypothetical protein